MKKFVSLLLVMGIIFSMTACGQKTNPPSLDSGSEEISRAGLPVSPSDGSPGYAFICGEYAQISSGKEGTN